MFKTKIDRFETLSIHVEMVELPRFKVICSIKQKQLGFFPLCALSAHTTGKRKKAYEK